MTDSKTIAVNPYEHDTFRIYLELPEQWELEQYPEDFKIIPLQLYEKYLTIEEQYQQVQKELREALGDLR